MDREVAASGSPQGFDGLAVTGGPDVTGDGSDRDLWAWAELVDEEIQVDISSCRVTAVLVTHDAARWLPQTLNALEALTHRPTRLIAIDNDSADRSRGYLEAAHDRGLIDAVYAGKRSFGFGAAVRSALTQDGHSLEAEKAMPAEGNGTEQSEWLWLLHDDAVPAANALERLVSHVVSEPAIDITGPKLLLPKRRHAPQQLSELGVSISGTGRRETYLDTGEIDQGQRDVPVERLAISTCGMLIRRSVWCQLGGFDRALPIFRDGVDLGWRAHLSGHHVMTTPDAEMVHRQVGRAGLRPGGAAGPRPGKTDRELGMLVVAAHASAGALPLTFLRLVWSCLLHAAGYLLGKVPGRSLDEILALGSFITHPGRIHRMRKRLKKLEVQPHAEAALDSLRPPWWSSLRVAAEVVTGAASNRYHFVAGESEASSLDELTGDDFASVSEDKPKSPWLSPIVICGVLTVIGSLVAARSLLRLGSLSAPTLLPAPATLSAAWAAVTDPIAGAPGISAPPWMALTALGSTLAAGRPEWFITVLLVGVVPLSLISAYPVVRRTITDRRVRLWAAVTYSLLPALLGGTNQGRLAISVFAIALPLLVLAGRALVLRRPRSPEAWRGGWGAGLVLVALIAFEPSMLILAVVFGLVGAVALRRTPRKIGRIAIALGVPLVVLAPWWPSIFTDWGRLSTGPDPALNGAPDAPGVWALLLGREAGGGLPPIWVAAIVFGAVWAVALLGLGHRRGNRAVRAGWIVALLSFALAVVLSRLVVTVPPVGAETRPWVGVYLLIAFAALILAGGVGVDGLTAALGSRSFSLVQPAAVLGGAVIGLISLVAAGWWVWGGMSRPIERNTLTAIPPYVLNAQLSDIRVRTLAIDLSGDASRFTVIADDLSRLGDAERGFAFSGSTSAPQQAEELASRMLAGTADEDIAPQLADLGIGFVWVRGADEQEQSRIDNTPGLGAASGNEQGTVWQLSSPVARAVIVDGVQRIPVVGSSISLPTSANARELRIGEASDPRWRATFNGVELQPVTSSNWQQIFEVPATAGTVGFSMPSRSVGWLIVQGILLAVAAVLAAPAVRRPEGRDRAKSARRAATVAGVDAP